MFPGHLEPPGHLLGKALRHLLKGRDSAASARLILKAGNRVILTAQWERTYLSWAQAWWGPCFPFIWPGGVAALPYTKGVPTCEKRKSRRADRSTWRSATVAGADSKG